LNGFFEKFLTILFPVIVCRLDKLPDSLTSLLPLPGVGEVGEAEDKKRKKSKTC
jgi:hypothetical protein